MDVASFTIDHDKLLKGLYVSRKDYLTGGACVTTFDVRMKLANGEPPLDVPAIHTLEHLMAVYLRSADSGIADDVIYVGPMGCRTGMYLILKGERTSEEILPFVAGTYRFMMNFKGEIPATTSKECGNYLEHNLFLAKWEAKQFYETTLSCMKPENMAYPV